ncbi:unnamed protein product [Dracunculus medinensis]|uniref:C-type lectin domain-containing protein n=1 Tax=Dracunculus medinensis TaxID=318479 RepID=A0A0N4U631_DRAME|nr:unnamed protein product [Dracunculus medinensis]
MCMSPKYCTSDAQCRVFEHCFLNKCVRDTRACPGSTCPAGMVCVNGQCLPDPLIATPRPGAGGCPSPWMLNEQFNACYYVGRSSYNFFTASAECRRLGGTVTSIGSIAEMTYVNGLVGAAAYWIGYHRTGFSSNWEDGSPVVFTNYRRGQPDGCCGGAGCLVGAAAYWIGYHRTGFASNWEDGSPVVFTNYRRGQPDGCCGGAGCTLVNYRGNMGEWDDAGCHIIWRIPTYVVCKRPL